MQVGEACRALTTPASWLWLSYLATNPGHDASSRKDRTCNITVPVKDHPHSKRTGEGLGGVEAKRTGGREICVSCCSFDPTGKQIIQEEGHGKGEGKRGALTVSSVSIDAKALWSAAKPKCAPMVAASCSCLSSKEEPRCSSYSAILSQ